MLIVWALALQGAHAVTLTPGAITPISTGVTVFFTRRVIATCRIFIVVVVVITTFVIFIII